MTSIIEAAREYADYSNSFNATQEAQQFDIFKKEVKASVIAYFKKGGTSQQLLEMYSNVPGLAMDRLKAKVMRYEKKHGSNVQEDIKKDPKIGRVVADLLLLAEIDAEYPKRAALGSSSKLSAHYKVIDTMQFPLLSGPKALTLVTYKDFHSGVKKGLFGAAVKNSIKGLKTSEEYTSKLREITQELRASQVDPKTVSKVETWIYKAAKKNGIQMPLRSKL